LLNKKLCKSTPNYDKFISAQNLRSLRVTKPNMLTIDIWFGSDKLFFYFFVFFSLIFMPNTQQIILGCQTLFYIKFDLYFFYYYFYQKKIQFHSLIFDLLAIEFHYFFFNLPFIK
jgi:hypothetical protein